MHGRTVRRGIVERGQRHPFYARGLPGGYSYKILCKTWSSVHFCRNSGGGAPLFKIMEHQILKYESNISNTQIILEILNFGTPLENSECKYQVLLLHGKILADPGKRKSTTPKCS